MIFDQAEALSSKRAIPPNKIDVKKVALERRQERMKALSRNLEVCDLLDI